MDKNKKWKRKKDWNFDDIFENFEKLTEFLEEEFNRMFEEPNFNIFDSFFKEKPLIYGFSISIDPTGKPRIQEFGNISPKGEKPLISDKREPLIDIINNENEIIIIAEIPGVKKDDIELNATEDTLIISVSNPYRKYYKELHLEEKIDPYSIQSSYNNGVLQIKLRKNEFKGKEIKIS
ncbi:MAG: archaeal heat shock protein Hsp20 [Nitrososphaerota archaeon]